MQQLFSKQGCFLPAWMICSVLVLGMAVVQPTHAQLIFYTPSVDFGKIEVGDSSPMILVGLSNTGDQPLVVNCTGGIASPVQFTAFQACQGNTLNPGETCPYAFSFTPVAAGALTGSSNPTCNSVPLSVNLSGEGVLPKLVFDTPTINFGPVLVDSVAPPIAVKLFNKGTAPVTVSCAGGIPSLPQFDSGQACQGITLNPGDSCPFSYNFTPDVADSFTGSSSVFCNGVSLNTQLLGEGLLPALVVDTDAVDFGTVTTSTTSPTVSVNLRNQGPDPVTISCAGGAPSQPQFGSGQACQGNSLNSGDACTFSFNFTPAVPGEITGVSNFSCNGVALNVALRGVGVSGLPDTGLSFDNPSVDFGRIELGNSSPAFKANLRNTGGQPLVINCLGGTASPAQFSASQACQGNTLNPGETCQYNFNFTPGAAGALTGISNPTCNSVPLSVELAGEGVLPKLVLNTPSVNFGPVSVGAASPLIAVKLFNKGAAPVTLSCGGGAPSQPQFGSSQACQGITLNPGDSCPLSYNFTPDAAGSFSASSNVFCNGVILSALLLGEGLLPALVVDTPAVDFGPVKAGATSAIVSVNLRNQGLDPVTLSCAAGVPSQPQFGAGQACQGNTLNSGDICSWSFDFTPDLPGEITGTSNFICNGVALGVALRGVGGEIFIFADSFE